MTDVLPLVSPLRDNPAGWPRELLPLFERSVTAEFASLGRTGQPITVPLTPYVGEDGRTLDVCTGVTYPAKAERARRNPRVCLLYADAVGAGLPGGPIAMVQGLATVRDRDLQAGTDRYLRLQLARFPGTFKGQPRFLLRGAAWYLARIWIHVTPVRVRWWPDGHLDTAPHEWRAGPETVAAPSDPSPPGKPPPPWTTAPVDWRRAAGLAVQRLDLRDLTVVDADGYPLCVPVGRVSEDAAGFRLVLPGGVGPIPDGPACLTFHTHAHGWPQANTHQENRTFLGRLAADGPTTVFRVERLLADWSLSGSKLRFTLDFLSKQRQMTPRLRTEAARRSQPVPRVRFPDEG
jgi:hypothetical protein